MDVIWDRGPISVRDVVVAVNETRDTPIVRNTVLKQIQRLEEKGWLRRVAGKRPAMYLAAANRHVAERAMAASLRDTLFGGSPLALVRSLIGDGSLTPGQVAELRQLIDEAESAQTKEAK